MASDIKLTDPATAPPTLPLPGASTAPPPTPPRVPLDKPDCFWITLVPDKEKSKTEPKIKTVRDAQRELHEHIDAEKVKGFKINVFSVQIVNTEFYAWFYRVPV